MQDLEGYETEFNDSDYDSDTDMYAHQNLGVQRMLEFERKPRYRIRGGILADDVGLGKTIQVLRVIKESYLKYNENGPTLICVPAQLIAQWESHCQRWITDALGPEWEPLVLTAQNVRNITTIESRIVIASYTTFLTPLDQHPLLATRFLRVVFDEAHKLKTLNTCIAMFARLIVRTYTWCVTATPVTNKKFMRRLPVDNKNRTTDLIALFVQLLAGTGSDRTLRKKAREITNDPDDVKKFIIRRAKDDVNVKLPKLRVKMETVDFTRNEQAEYNAHREEALRILDRMGDDEAGQLLAKITHMRKTAAMAIEKIDVITQYIANEPPGQKILVFGNFHDEIDAIAEAVRLHNIECYVFDGRTKQQDSVVREFVERQGTTVMVINYQKAVGLNLQVSGLVILASPAWAATSEKQAIGRAHRINSAQDVRVVRIAVAGSIEQFMQKRQQGKLQTAAVLLDDDRLLCKQVVNWNDDREMFV